MLNKTLKEAETAISLKAKEFLINPFVIVKLANFQFTILGEVNAPGNYPIYKEVITIYDAIAMAGGINDYGNLQKVKIVRSENNKKQICAETLRSERCKRWNPKWITQQQMRGNHREQRTQR